MCTANIVSFNNTSGFFEVGVLFFERISKTVW